MKNEFEIVVVEHPREGMRVEERSDGSVRVVKEVTQEEMDRLFEVAKKARAEAMAEAGGDEDAFPALVAQETEPKGSMKKKGGKR